jgi:hypothetical protein
VEAWVAVFLACLARRTLRGMMIVLESRRIDDAGRFVSN